LLKEHDDPRPAAARAELLSTLPHFDIEAAQASSLPDVHDRERAIDQIAANRLGTTSRRMLLMHLGQALERTLPQQ
jgi:hypothetical protein